MFYIHFVSLYVAFLILFVANHRFCVQNGLKDLCMLQKADPISIFVVSAFFCKGADKRQRRGNGCTHRLLPEA